MVWGADRENSVLQQIQPALTKTIHLYSYGRFLMDLLASCKAFFSQQKRFSLNFVKKPPVYSRSQQHVDFLHGSHLGSLELESGRGGCDGAEARRLRRRRSAAAATAQKRGGCDGAEARRLRRRRSAAAATAQKRGGCDGAEARRLRRRRSAAAATAQKRGGCDGAEARRLRRRRSAAAATAQKRGGCDGAEARRLRRRRSAAAATAQKRGRGAQGETSAERSPRGATPRPKSEAAVKRSYPTSKDLSFASSPPAGNHRAFRHLAEPPWATRLLSCSCRQPHIQRVEKHCLPFVNPSKAISFLLTTSSKKNGVKEHQRRVSELGSNHHSLGDRIHTHESHW
ncbi:uncharacterized protein LOC133240937 [Bos javanicus]|uniref:uncharacterized protein LOC133240937 n=1 Tax=Bos javanicus TaxID=9906 RepID=UPI002AA81364|nr:uncharacterized protein LOC133240937 [Bos javanicus]